MENRMVKQAQYHTAQTSLDPNRGVELIAIFDGSGALINPGAAGAAGTAGAPGADASVGSVTVATAIGTAAKTTSAAEPAANKIVPIKFTNGNSAASPTVAFNGGTARTILLGGTAPSGAEITVAANGIALFWFDGTILHQLGVYS